MTHRLHMNLISDKNFMSEEQKQYINNVVLKDNFPWYFMDNAVNKNDKNWFFFHIVVKRPEQCNEHENRVNSEHANFFIEVLDNFCKKNKIEYTKVFRIAVNLVVPNGVKESFIHEDHDFPHKQLIVYLTDNKESTTNIYSSDYKTLLHSIKTEKFKGVTFDKVPHSVTLPKKDRRVVIVYTYK